MVRFYRTGTGQLHGHTCAGTADHSQGHAAARAVPVPLLHHGLHRPRERRFRRPADADRSGVQRHRLFVRGRHLLRRVLLLRGPEQRDPRAGRRAVVDRPHHDPLGTHLLDDDVREDGVGVLRAALSARRWRGGVLSRHHPVPHVLVPVRVSIAHGGALHDGGRALRRRRRSVVGPAAGSPAVRPPRMAMAVSDRRRARGVVRHRRAAVPAERPARRPVPLARRTGMAGGANRRGARPAGAAERPSVAVADAGEQEGPDSQPAVLPPRDRRLRPRHVHAEDPRRRVPEREQVHAGADRSDTAALYGSRHGVLGPAVGQNGRAELARRARRLVRGRRPRARVVQCSTLDRARGPGARRVWPMELHPALLGSANRVSERHVGSRRHRHDQCDREPWRLRRARTSWARCAI